MWHLDEHAVLVNCFCHKLGNIKAVYRRITSAFGTDATAMESLYSYLAFKIQKLGHQRKDSGKNDRIIKELKDTVSCRGGRD